MLPTDAKTYAVHIPLNGSGDYIIENNTLDKTVLGFAALQKNVASDTKLLCGTSQIFDNFATSTPYFSMNYVCKDILKIEKTGNDEAVVIVNYVMRDRTTVIDADITAVVSQDPQLLSTTLMQDGNKFEVQRTYTFGDLTIVLLLIPIACLLAYKTILQAFRKPVQYHK